MYFPLPRAAPQSEEIPESETKATALDNKLAGCLSEDRCGLPSANAIREGEPEGGKKICRAFPPPDVRRVLCL